MNSYPLHCPICDEKLRYFKTAATNRIIFYCPSERDTVDEFCMTINEEGNIVDLQYHLEEIRLSIRNNQTFIQNWNYEDILHLNYALILESFDLGYIEQKVKLLITFS